MKGSLYPPIFIIHEQTSKGSAECHIPTSHKTRSGYSTQKKKKKKVRKKETYVTVSTHYYILDTNNKNKFQSQQYNLKHG